MKRELGCIICGEGMGFLDNYGRVPCWGCNYATCEKCGSATPYDVECVDCGFINKFNGKYM